MASPDVISFSIEDSGPIRSLAGTAVAIVERQPSARAWTLSALFAADDAQNLVWSRMPRMSGKFGARNAAKCSDNAFKAVNAAACSASDASG